MILVVYVLSTWAGAAAVQAQGAGPVPDITLTCSQPSPIDVEPGSPRSTIVNCNLENPSVHQVKVEIRIQAGNLAYSGPASVTVGNGNSASFQVTLRADLRAAEGSQTVAITAEVTQANGIPVTSSPSTYTVLAIIRQFSRLRVESDTAFIQLRPKVDTELVFAIYNDGNAMDRFAIGIDNREELNDEGFQLSIPLVSVEIESMAPPKKIYVQMRTPKNQGWTDKYYSLNFKATSDYSIKTVGIADFHIQTMTIYIRGIYLPGFELVGTMMISALAAAALAGRGTREGEGDAIDENGNVVPLETPTL